MEHSQYGESTMASADQVRKLNCIIFIIWNAFYIVQFLCDLYHICIHEKYCINWKYKSKLHWIYVIYVTYIP